LSSDPQSLINFREVRESGQKPDHVHRVYTTSMYLNDVVRGQPAYAAYDVKVWCECLVIANGDDHLSTFPSHIGNAFRAGNRLTQDIFDITNTRVRTHEPIQWCRIVNNGQGAVGDDDIKQTRKRMVLQPTTHRHNPLVVHWIQV